MPSIQVVPRTLSSCRDERVFYLLKSGACKAGINFHKLAYPKIYYDLFAKQIYRKSEGFEVHSSFEVYSSFLRGLSDFHIDSKTAAKTAPS